MFKNRNEAGAYLAHNLQKYKDTNSVVIALPRGGVVLGRVIADTLSLPLDIVSVRKIGHPLDLEYAIGAVDANGTTVLNREEACLSYRHWIKREIGRQKEEAKRRQEIYRKGERGLDISGKNVILVDDGIATGFSMRLAVRVLRKEKPKKIIVALPVASVEAVEMIKHEGVNEIVLLLPPERFTGAVGAHYREFEQLKDEDVIGLLNF